MGKGGWKGGQQQRAHFNDCTAIKSHYGGRDTRWEGNEILRPRSIGRAEGKDRKGQRVVDNREIE